MQEKHVAMGVRPSGCMGRGGWRPGTCGKLAGQTMPSVGALVCLVLHRGAALLEEKASPRERWCHCRGPEQNLSSHMQGRLRRPTAGTPWANATNYIGEILGLRCGAPPHLAFVAPLALALYRPQVE